MVVLKKLWRKIQRDGWGSMPEAFRYHLDIWSKNAYRQLVLRNKVVVKMMPMQQPPILLLSYPRSGSSWMGEILATSDDIAYLFEPVTLQYQKYSRGTALADLSFVETNQAYQQYSQEAFLGVPLKEPLSPEKLADFSPLVRRNRRLLIKEVNPRAAGFFSQYQPFFLLLLRHPAAVALSFWEMGWLEASDVHLESVNFSGGIWEKFGYSYGMTMKNALDEIKASNLPHKILFYEQLATNPLVEYKNLFLDLSIELPQNYETIIDEYCFSGSALQGYETRRVSKLMVTKWKNKLSPERIKMVRSGYLESGFDFYRSDSDW